MQLGHQLHKVAGGRIFVRGAVAEPDGYSHTKAQRDRYRDAILLVGVVEVPKSADLERMHDVRLNSHLWLDTVNARPVRAHMGPEDIKECDIGHLLTQIKFGAGPVPDYFEVFLRGTLLKHDRPDMRWAFIAGAVAQRLDALPIDGLYEFESNIEGFRLVSNNIYAGCPPSNILRQPIWGPGGTWGTSTSMEPGRFPGWLAEERSKPPSRFEDPRFRAFVKLMNERCPELHSYTADQYAERERISKEVVRQLATADAAANEATLVASTTPRRARP